MEKAIEIVEKQLEEAEENRAYWFDKTYNGKESAKRRKQASEAYDMYITKIVTLNKVLNALKASK